MTSPQPYNTAWASSTGARRRRTNSEAVNGPQVASPSGGIGMSRNLPQPPHYFFGEFSHRHERQSSPNGPNASHRKPCTMTTIAKLDGGRPNSPALPPSFPFPQVNNVIQFASPVRVLAKQNMEQSVSEVCKTKSCSVSASDIEQARQIHQRLVVRMMTSPGDSKGSMYRIEAAFGLSYHCQVNLRHQNRASAEFITRLHAAWTCVLEQSVRRDVAELLSVQGEAAE